MLSRKVTNIIRFILDELLPPIIRDSRYFMYPLLWIWFKGKNVKRFMDFKEIFHTLSDEEFNSYYEDYEYIADRLTDLSETSINFIINQLGNDKEISIVDVGCGSGYVLKRILDSGYQNISGFDIVSHSQFDNININVGNVENLPVPDKSFDVVICSHTLEHVLDLSKAINELKRITKNTLIITVPKQRYYKYTFDLHLHFFPQVSYLLKYLNISHDKIKYKNIKGDWTIVCDMN